MRICLSCARARLKNPSVPLCASCACEVKLTSRERLQVAMRKSASSSAARAEAQQGYKAWWPNHPSLFRPRGL